MSVYSGKVAVVTGAGSGIGRGLGTALARAGALVALADISAQRVEETAEAIRRQGYEAEGHRLDVTDAEAVGGLIRETASKHGRLDYLFNNAGIAVGGEVRDCALDDWRRVIEVNLHGVIHGVDAAYPIMVKQGFGHIVNTASIEGLVPFPGTASYAASKYGVVGLSESLRIEGEDLGVKVSVVCPGYVKTNIFCDSKMIGLDRGKILEDLEKNFKGITPDRCADLILAGVARNKAIIVLTGFAKFLWTLQRISPALVRRIMKRNLQQMRRDVRIE